jgi:hypothetical protein
LEDLRGPLELGTPFVDRYQAPVRPVTLEAFVHVPLIERHSVVDATLPLERHPFQVPGGLLGKPLAFIHS